MCAVQLLRVTVHERITAAAEDFLLFLETRKETAEIPDLRTLLNQRLTAAAEEILGLFEKTVAEYEDKVHQSEKEMCRQRNLLNIVLNPEVKLHRAVLPQQLMVIKEEVPPEQQECSPSLDQDEPEHQHIKEEQEELPTSQERGQHQSMQEADITKLLFTPVTVKSEDDEEKAESSQGYQRPTEENGEAEPLSSSSSEHIETETDGEDCVGSEPARNLDPVGELQPAIDGQLLSSHSSEPETEDSEDDQGETRECASCFKTSNDTLFSHDRSNIVAKPSLCLKRKHTGEKPLSCSVCDKNCKHRVNFKIHMMMHKRAKPYSCSVCGKSFTLEVNLEAHMRVHAGKKPFSCSVCGESFTKKQSVNIHMRVHTGEKPFSCSVCGKSFTLKQNVSAHMRIHTGEKPFSCSVCGKCFTEKQKVNRHMRIHTGEKPFSCSVCGKCFTEKQKVNRHMRIHTGEKPFSCLFCSKGFTRKDDFNRHMTIHTGEKSFHCSVCGRSFRRREHVRSHKCAGESSSR
ncbi:gastrula zinc finger protein XlCGF57.1-like isoform X1 [Myripristis murdjan]|uniref:gastrula zinc finger protein XlCGF57.1-like isoform X1 n=1 Tax=Myripristis murdjan TaxID=586833 RepID=UPI00117618F2|nr:gastrula zinc finger protein XlCGF57.1-like isoform X1 [Myripristis murdjan]